MDDDKLYRTDALIIAVREGIMAGLNSDKRWGVLCAIYDHLPHPYPGKDRIMERTGCSASTIDRALKALRAVGLIDFADGNAGGRFKANQYAVADIRDEAIRKRIISTLKGADDKPLHGKPLHHEPLYPDESNPPMMTHPPRWWRQTPRP